MLSRGHADWLFEQFFPMRGSPKAVCDACIAGAFVSLTEVPVTVAWLVERSARQLSSDIVTIPPHRRNHLSPSESPTRSDCKRRCRPERNGGS